jgi:hypothetical protein
MPTDHTTFEFRRQYYRDYAFLINNGEALTPNDPALKVISNLDKMTATKVSTADDLWFLVRDASTALGYKSRALARGFFKPYIRRFPARDRSGVPQRLAFVPLWSIVEAAGKFTSSATLQS